MRLLLIALLAAGCSAAPGPPQPEATSAAGTFAVGPTGAPNDTPTATPIQAVRATSGIATAATVRGTIYLGFEACVALTPDASSPYLPPTGQDDFVLLLPRGWKVVAAHPVHPRFGDHFKLLDRDGRVVAHDADVLEVTGEIRATEATYCGFGWPIKVRAAHRVGG